MKKIIIIGAGASGVYLSILLKQKLEYQCEIIVLEQNASPLKKLLATGNGRCNLSNKDMSVDYFSTDQKDYVQDIIDQFDMLKQINELGLYCVYQGNLLYPKSEQALSVKQVMMNCANELGVSFFYNQEVISIEQSKRYLVHTTHQTYQADYVIFAMGSEAGKLSGVNNSRYDILKKLKLDVVKSTPSLVQMTTLPVIKEWKGVRVKGTFSLLENNQCIHKEKGELLFTDYGVSGIAVMQLSAFYQENHQYELSIDFFDDQDVKKLHEYVELRMNKGYNHFYDGLLHNKISTYFARRNLTSTLEIVKLFKDFRLQVTGIRSYETAQVMKGGLSLLEVNHDLQIEKYPHLYAVGEILNVAGLCGGYNLHFAFASAYRVAQAIEREFHAKNK